MTDEIKPLDFFECLEKNEFFIIICGDSEKRKLIHMFIEYNYPRINNIGLRLDGYNKETKRVSKCINCNCSANVPILKKNYCYGSMENNKDEYYHITCYKCDRRWTWEPNYDGCDNVHYYDDNNCILIGNFLGLKYNSHKNREWKKVKKNDIESIVKECEIQIINKPTKVLKKKILQQFVNDEMLLFKKIKKSNVL